MKMVILTSTSVTIAVFISLFGGWDTGIYTLLTFIAIDYITGILCGLMKKSKKTYDGGISSNTSFNGLIKKIGILIALIIAVRLDNVLKLNNITRTAVIIFFTLNEGISILENLSLIGLPLPNALWRALELLQDKDKNE